MERPTGEQIAAFLADHGMSQSEAARRAKVHRTTLIRWLQEGTADAYAPTLRQLVELIRRVDKRAGLPKRELG